MKLNIGFIGLGIIGGSLAKAIREFHPDSYILAYNRSLPPLAAAKKEGVIDEICEEVNHRFRCCDYIFLCAPVSTNIQYMKLLKEYISPDCILSDVGSVKGMIHQQATELSLTNCFIGGHPMAGSEKTGYDNSKARLLENAYYILTPAEHVNIQKIANYTELVSSLGAIPLVLTHQEHDYITAGISHLPHIVAAALVNLVRELDTEDEHMKLIAAGGFKDITRIASSSPDMWQQICLENPENISQTLDAYIRMLIQIRYQVDHKEAPQLYDLFSQARDYRDSIEILPEGPLRKSYFLYCDIADEPGGIATIATLLAMEQISIKNIGIIHNREFEEGVLRIDFYEGGDCEKALEILKKRNYIIHIR